MNASEERGPLALRVRHVRQPLNFTKTEEFRVEFLGSPCLGCGKEHSLMTIESSPRTRSGRSIYQYNCPVVEYDDLYVRNPRYPDDEITITYYIISERYAAIHGYNEDEALSKISCLYKGRIPEPPWYMDSFIGEVKRICRNHVQGEDPPDHSNMTWKGNSYNK